MADSALAVECMAHFPSRQHFLAEVARVLPTYAVVRGLFAAMGAPQAEADTRRIEQLSRWGVLRYRILGFSKS